MPKQYPKGQLKPGEGKTPTETLEIKALRKAIVRLREQIKEMSLNSECTPEPAEIEKRAKAISACLKSIEDLKLEAEKRAKDHDAALYTPYEDYPPPSPERRDQFIAEIQAALPPFDDPRSPLGAMVDDAVRRYFADAAHMAAILPAGSDGSERDES